MSDDDATAELHMRDGMVWHRPLSTQSRILCIYCIGNFFVSKLKFLLKVT